jgi:diguanylate cyclase (GGDEF)-like protein
MATAGEILVLAGTVVRVIEDYGERTSKLVRAQSRELQAMIAMLTRTVADIADGSARNLICLADIEKQVERATQVDDVRKLKLHLAECLEDLREESARQRAATERTVTQLKSEIEKSRRRAESHTDVLTGLPGRPEAEEALEQACSAEENRYLGVMVVEGIESLNTRFGRNVGDDVLVMFCQHLALGLAPGDLVFRWSGPSFLAIFNRFETAEQARAEMRRTLSVNLETSVEVGGRAVNLPISVLWMVTAVGRNIDFLVRQVEEFVAGTAGVPVGLS